MNNYTSGKEFIWVVVKGHPCLLQNFRCDLEKGGGSGLLSHWSIVSDSALWELFVYYSVETSWDVFLANLIVNYRNILGL